MNWFGALLLWVAAAVVGAVVVFGLALVILGPARVWGVFGPADLGDVNLETLMRRTTPNDALAAPENWGNARKDIISPSYRLPASRLREVFRRAIAGERQLERVAASDDTLSERYVQRTRLMGYPDTIIVRFIEQGGGGASIVMYSRSKLGRSDLGANKARLERWLTLIRNSIS